MRRKIRRTGLYVRKSRADIEQERKAKERGEEYDTLRRHRNELIRLARKNDYTIVEIYEEIVSADTIKDRPQMQRLLKDVEDYKFDAILVVDYDRLGRGDKTDQGLIETAFAETDTLIITPHEIIDLNTEEGQFKADTKGFISRMEYRQIKRRLKEGKKRSALEGKDISNKQPFGYDKDRDTKKLVPNQYAQYVKLAFELYDEIGTLNGVLQEFERIGIPTLNNAKWQPITLSRMLRNKKYIGVMFYGRETKRDYVEVEHAHTPIVDEELFYKVNKKLDNVKSHRTNKRFELKNPFASVGRCMKCGSATKYHNVYAEYIRCSNEKCSHRFIQLEHYEKAVLNELKNILDSITVDVSKLKPSKNKSDLLQRQRQALKKEEEKLDVRNDNLYRFLEDGTYTNEVFKERLELLNVEREELAAKLLNIESQLQEEIENQKRMTSMLPNIKTALDIYHDANIVQKNKIIKSIIKEIRSYKETRSDRYGNNRDDFVIEIILNE